MKKKLVIIHIKCCILRKYYLSYNEDSISSERVPMLWIIFDPIVFFYLYFPSTYKY